MKLIYTVIHEFVIKGSKVIELDRNMPASNNENLTFTMNGKVYPYKLTHNLQLLVVDSMDDFEGHTIEFSGNVWEAYTDIKSYSSIYKNKA